MQVQLAHSVKETVLMIRIVPEILFVDKIIVVGDFSMALIAAQQYQVTV